MESDEMKAFEEDEVLLGLMQFLAFLPKPTLQVLNVKRYRDMIKSVASLKQLLAVDGNSGEFNLRLDETFRLGSISAELDELSTVDISLLCEALSSADCLEIYPLTNGKLRVVLTFQSVLKTIC